MLKFKKWVPAYLRNALLDDNSIRKPLKMRSIKNEGNEKILTIICELSG